jgi:putative phosphoesterase
MIALISDTHGNTGATRRALVRLREATPERFVHLGDVGGREIVELFHGLELTVLLGNNDLDRVALHEAVSKVGGELRETIELSGRAGRILVTHGHTAAIPNAIKEGGYAAVVFGHSHVAVNEVRNGVRFINPGALYRAREYSCALFDPDTLEVVFVPIPKE